MLAQTKAVIAAAVLSISALVLSTAAEAESPTLAKIKSSGSITLGYREASIPFSYLGADQKPVGFSLDLCSAIVDRIRSELKLDKLAVNLTPVNSSNRIPLIQNGTIDIECGGTANSLARQKQVDFSVATFVSQPRWLVKSDAGIKTTTGLKGKTVVVTQGSNAIDFARAADSSEKLGLSIVQAKDHAESLLMIETGRASAFLEDNILLAGLKAEAPNPASLSFLPGGYQELYYGLMLPKGDAEFKALVDKVLSEEMASGQFSKTYAKWFTSPIPPKGINLEFPMSEALKERVAHPSDKVDY